MTLEPTKHGFKIIGSKGTVLGEFVCLCGSKKHESREWAAVAIDGAEGRTEFFLSKRKMKVVRSNARTQQ